MGKKILFLDKNIGRVGDYVDQHLEKTKKLKVITIIKFIFFM